MSSLNSSIKTAKLYQKFYEKTGIRLTEDPIKSSPSEIDEEMEELYHLSRTNPKKAFPRLEKLVEEYPQVPSLKNYLYVSYMFAKRPKKAAAILDQTIEAHPDYIFGINNKLLIAEEDEEINKYGKMLGEKRDIRFLKPNVDKYHILEFGAFQTAAGIYEAHIGDEKSALERLDSLIELEIDENTQKELAKRISIARLKKGSAMFGGGREDQITVESFPKIKYEQAAEPPQLENELDVLYQLSTGDLDEAIRDDIMALPKDSLIRDLELVLEDSIRRYEHFQKQEYDVNTHDFPTHAIHFLTALNAKGSLSKILDMLRMGSGFTEFWFGDYRESVIRPALYLLGNDQLDVFKDFVLEKNIYAYNRIDGCYIAAQVALHQPERRAEVVKWFEDVINHLFEHEAEEGLIDSDFCSFTVSYTLDFRGTELLPLIEKMYEKGWVIEFVQGDLKAIKKEIELPNDPHYIDPMPQNIHEHYTEEHQSRKAPMAEWRKKEFDEEQVTKAEKMVMNVGMDMLLGKLRKSSSDANDYFDDYEEGYGEYSPPPVETVKREAPKVGRNDPCPCGSGKKYKKCCLKKK